MLGARQMSLGRKGAHHVLGIICFRLLRWFIRRSSSVGLLLGARAKRRHPFRSAAAASLRISRTEAAPTRKELQQWEKRAGSACRDSWQVYGDKENCRLSPTKSRGIPAFFVRTRKRAPLNSRTVGRAFVTLPFLLLPETRAYSRKEGPSSPNPFVLQDKTRREGPLL